jgi:aspartate aminotransferase
LDVRDLLGEKFTKSEAVADYLLTEAQVVTTDGAGFGAEGFLRLSYATSMKNLETAIGRMKKLFNTQSGTLANV